LAAESSAVAQGKEPLPYAAGDDETWIAFRPGSRDELLITRQAGGGVTVYAAFDAAHRLLVKARIMAPHTAAAFLGRDRILTADKRGVVTAWSLEGKSVGTFAATGAAIKGLHVSPRGRLVAIRHERMIRLLSAAGQPVGAPIATGYGRKEDCLDEFGSRAVVFSLDEAKLAAADACGDLLVARVGGQRLPIAENDRLLVNRLAFSRDGRTLILGYFGMPGGGADFRSVAADRVSAPRKVPGPFTHADPQAVVALGDDRFVVASVHRLRFIASDGRKLRSDVDIAAPRLLAASDDGERFVVLAAEGTVLFDRDGKRLAPRAFAEFGMPSEAELLPGGRSIVSLSPNGLLHFWTTEGVPLRAPVEVWEHAALPDFSEAQGRLLLSSARATLAVIAPTNHVILVDLEGKTHGRPIAMPSDGEDRRLELGAFALHDDRLLLPDPAGRSLSLFSLDGAALAKGLAVSQGRITAAAFAPGGGRIATGDERGVVRVWAIDGALLKERKPRIGRAKYGEIAFSPDGRTLVAQDHSYERDEIMVWHLDLDRVEHRAGRFIRFLADGAMVRQRDRSLVIDAPDGAERLETRIDGAARLVLDDASAALAVHRGVARMIRLGQRR
jgi:WD40 repeat protein